MSLTTTAAPMTRSTIVVAACALLILLLIGGVSIRGTTQNEDHRTWVNHTHVVIASLESILLDITAAEAFQRTYLLTADERYLSACDTASKQALQDIDLVRELTKDNPQQQIAIERLKPIVMARVDALRYRIEVRKNQGLTASIEAVSRGNPGEALMDQTRALIAEMRSTEEKLLTTRENAATAGGRRVRLLIVIGNAFALLLFSFAALAIHRETRKRNLAEANLKRANADLEHRSAELSDTNSELESFSYSVAHDLRAPLRQISGYSNVLIQEYGPKLESDASHLLQKIDQGAKTMGHLVDDLLSLSRVGRQDLSIERTSLDAILRQVIRECGADSTGRNIEWQISQLSDADCDPALMKQVFMNLISNAVKYTRKRERAMIRVVETEKDGERIICIGDNGAGFDMRYAGKLFGVFQRLHKARDFEGTGVGLAIVQRIIRKHGGRIWAEAEEDRGATFYFTLKSARKNVARQYFSGKIEEEVYVA
jgi:signal transduction histidine kinase